MTDIDLCYHIIYRSYDPITYLQLFNNKLHAGFRSLNPYNGSIQSLKAIILNPFVVIALAVQTGPSGLPEPRGPGSSWTGSNGRLHYFSQSTVRTTLEHGPQSVLYINKEQSVQEMSNNFHRRTCVEEFSYGIFSLSKAFSFSKQLQPISNSS